MKAILMADREGRGLRPLTCDMPPAVMPLCGKPLLGYLLERLREAGVGEAVIVTGYLPHLVEGSFPDRTYSGIKLDFLPAGDDLSEALAEKLRGQSEPVFFADADLLCDIDLSEALAFHMSGGAEGTVIAGRVSDRGRSRPIGADRDGVVTSLGGSARALGEDGALTGTGLCLFSPSALSLLGGGRGEHPAHHLLHSLFSHGRAIRCHVTERYWRRIEGIRDYIDCHVDLLNGAAGRAPESRKAPDGVAVTGMVCFGQNVHGAPGATVEGPCYIGDGCSLGRNARITRSVLLENARVADRSRLTGSLLCAGASAGAGAMLFEASVAGSGSAIGDHATVKPGVRVWNAKSVPEGTTLSSDLRDGETGPPRFGDEGLSGRIGGTLTPELAVRLGCAVGSVAGRGYVAVGCDSDRGAVMLGQAMAAGIRSTGADVMDFGENFLAQFCFSMNFCASRLGVYLCGGSHPSIRLLGSGGLPVPPEIERRIESLLTSGSFVRRPYDALGDLIPMAGMGGIYRSHLVRYAPDGLTGVSARVFCRNISAHGTLKQTLTRLGCDVTEGPRIELSAGGDRLRLYDEHFGYLSGQRIFTWCAVRQMRRGDSIALPDTAPHLLDAHAGRLGCTALRYGSGEDGEARTLAGMQRWQQDALMQAVILLDILRRQGGLGAALRGLPEVDVYSRETDPLPDPARVLGAFGPTDRLHGGVLLREGRGVVRLRPGRRGAGIRIIAEAANAEIAEELCADIEQRLRHIARADGP